MWKTFDDFIYRYYFINTANSSPLGGYNWLHVATSQKHHDKVTHLFCNVLYVWTNYRMFEYDINLTKELLII